VPGNHDVDQAIIRTKPTYVDVRKKLRKCKVAEIEDLLHYHLSESEVFYSPIKEYNEFAVELGCEVTVGRPVWDTKDEFKLNDGATLRVFGLNSSLVSDENDDIDTGKVVLGKYQAQIPIKEGVENLVVCHHPPDWLRDGDMTDETLNPRSCIQLFGHKHKHRLRILDGSLLQVAAGAVHPSRKESDWEPRYNWLVIWVEVADRKRTMKVEVYPRVWNKYEQSFDADRNNCDEGKRFRLVSLALSPFAASKKPEARPATENIVVGPANDSNLVFEDVPNTDSQKSKDSRGNPIMNARRTLARRYFQLGYVQKMRIATDLELLDDLDDQLPDHERQRRHLQRAKAKGVLAAFWERVEQEHGDGRYPDNPFADV
jgi:hypothetical protein